MFSKKIFLSAALASMAGLVACGDDSSSNASSKELPKSVPTFMDLDGVECNADRKCATILVEDHNDTYECDGVQQWNKLFDGMPSKVCPAEEKRAEGDENGEGEGTKTPDSSASTPVSTNSNTDSANSGASTGDSSDSEGSSNSKPVEMISCDNLPEEGQEAFGTMGEPCTEFEKGTMAATALELRCEDRGGTLGTGCPVKENKNNGNCIDKSQCNAMVKTDISTWHFTRADAFGEPSVYIYSVADNGTDLIVSIDGKEKSYSMYNMSNEIGIEMAFSAAKATCNDGMEVEGANYCD